MEMEGASHLVLIPCANAMMDTQEKIARLRVMVSVVAISLTAALGGIWRVLSNTNAHHLEDVNTYQREKRDLLLGVLSRTYQELQMHVPASMIVNA